MSNAKSKKFYVGTFNEADIDAGNDKIAVQEAMLKTGLKYTDTKLVRKDGQIVGLKIYLCDAKSFRV